MSYSPGPRRELSSSVSFQAAVIAQQLRRERQRRGWTMEEVARKTGISPSTVGYIERGRQIPALDTLLMLTDLYGLDVTVTRGDS